MQLIFLTIAIVFILSSETFLWTLFRRKTVGIRFPHELDTSFFRFFTLARVRMVALLHTLFLFTVVVFSLLFLW
jgi:hypothetical protein